MSSIRRKVKNDIYILEKVNMNHDKLRLYVDLNYKPGEKQGSGILGIKKRKAYHTFYFEYSVYQMPFHVVDHSSHKINPDVHYYEQDTITEIRDLDTLAHAVEYIFGDKDIKVPIYYLITSTFINKYTKYKMRYICTRED